VLKIKNQKASSPIENGFYRIEHQYWLV